MVDVPLSFTDSERVYADLPPATLKNRFFEKNATQAKGVALIARPATLDLATFGTGPIRATYSTVGLFNDSMFVASGTSMYRYETDGTTLPLVGALFGSGDVSMCGVKGADYERLFVADGTLLQVYQGGTHATGTLTGTGHVASGDTIQIGDTYYEWNDVISNGAGTAANPWKVLRGADLATDLANMVKAISFTGVQGTDFSANLGGQDPNVTVTATATTLTATARSDLSDGNLIATTVPTGATVSWGSATLTDGGTHALSGVEVPDGLPPGSVASLKSYVIFTLIGSDKFFYIAPGAIVVNALDFATAESRADPTVKVIVVGDTLWFVGEDSTEVWYATGNSNAPFAPVSGRVYDRGAIEGTVVNVKGEVFLVGPDNVVYGIAGAPTRVSDHGVEETIRKALGG